MARICPLSSFPLKSSLPSTVAAPTSNSTVLFHHNSACHHLSPQTQPLPTTGRQPLSYTRNMPSELYFKWGPPEHTRSITYGDLEILLLCVVPHEAPVTFHKIYTFENALRILSTGPTTIPGVYGVANPAHLKSTLESIRSDPAFKEFDVVWNTVERQQKAAGIFRERLREWINTKVLSQVLDIEKLRKKAIELLCVGLRCVSDAAAVATSMEKLFRENWNVTGYYKWGTITSRIVDGMRLYYQASEQGANPEWEKWAKMPWVQPEFQKSKKEFSDSLKG